MGIPDPGDNGGGYNAAKVLRLTFHDCLKYDDGTGGCDGCLNWSGMGIRYNGAENKRSYPDVGLTDNNGLRHTVEILEAIYQVICMSIRLCLNMKYNNNNVRSSPSPMEPPHWPAHSGSQVRAGLTSGPWLGLWLWSLGLRQTTGSAETHHPPLAVTISRASRAVPSPSTPPSPSGK